MRIMIPMVAALFLLASAATAVDDTDLSRMPAILAKVEDDVVTREDFLQDLEGTIGAQVRDKLFQQKIVELEKARRHLVISDDAVDARIRAMSRRDRRAHEMVGSGASLEALRRGVRFQLAVETMAKQDMRIHPELPISNIKTEKWLKQKLDSATIIGRRDKLPQNAYAMVNGHIITKDEFYRTLLLNSTKEQRRNCLEKLIGRLVIKNEMRKRNVEVADFDIDMEFKRMRRKIAEDPSRRGISLDEVLRLQGTSEIQLRNDIDFRLNIAAKKMMRVEVTDEEAKEYYNRHKARYNNGELRASEIFIPFVDLTTGRVTDPGAIRKAAELIKEIKAKLDAGEDFAKLARKYSKDASAKKGGDIGFFPRYGRVPDPIAAVAFSLTKGEISQPFLSNRGYHIVMVTDERVPKMADFELVKTEVINDMLEENLADWIAKLRRTYKIQRFWP